MKKTLKYCVLCILLAAITWLFWSCFTINTPPSEQHVKMRFVRDYHEILLVKEYMFNSGYTNIHIYKDCKTAFADFKQISIDDGAVVEALRSLQKKGYEGVEKHRSTIEFRYWTGLRDISCGIAYVSPGRKNEIQFITETQPLTQSEWYYYVADYEASRKTGDGFRKPY